MTWFLAITFSFYSFLIIPGYWAEKRKQWRWQEKLAQDRRNRLNGN